MMGSVAIVITSTLLLLWFLDNPYHHGRGGLRPTAMERTLALLTNETGIAGEHSRSHATRRESRAHAESSALIPGASGRLAPERTDHLRKGGGIR